MLTAGHRLQQSRGPDPPSVRLMSEWKAPTPWSQEAKPKWSLCPYSISTGLWTFPSQLYISTSSNWPFNPTDLGEPTMKRGYVVYPHLLPLVLSHEKISFCPHILLKSSQGWMFPSRAIRTPQICCVCGADSQQRGGWVTGGLRWTLWHLPPHQWQASPQPSPEQVTRPILAPHSEFVTKEENSQMP